MVVSCKMVSTHADILENIYIILKTTSAELLLKMNDFNFETIENLGSQVYEFRDWQGRDGLPGLSRLSWSMYGLPG